MRALTMMLMLSWVVPTIAIHAVAFRLGLGLGLATRSLHVCEL